MTDKIVVIPVMYTLKVSDAGSDTEVEDAARQLIMDLTEEIWYEEFNYADQTLDFVGFDWLNGAYVDLYRTDEEVASDNTEEETQERTSSESGTLRNPDDAL